MHVWNVLRAARWKIQDAKNRQKFAIWAPSHNFSGCIFATKACIDNRKKYLLNSNIFSRRSDKMANFGPLTLWSVYHFGAHQQILPGFVSWLHYCSDVAYRRPTKLCTIFGRLVGWYTIYTFWGLLPPDGILPRAKFTLHPSLAFSYIGSVRPTARHCSSGRQPNCGVVQGMKLQNFRRGRHLYSAGRPSRWASAHILVLNVRYCWS